MSHWVVIPAYNARSFIVATLESVLAQTRRDLRVVVVDDGSKDDTEAVARAIVTRDERVTWLRQDNAGVAAARNRGVAVALSSADCKAVLCLDSDDVLMPNALELLGGVLDRDSGATAAHGIARYIDKMGAPSRPGACEDWCRKRLRPEGLGVRQLDLTEPTTFESLVCVHGLPCPGVVLIRRSSLERVGNYDPNVAEASDWDMCIRLSRHGHLAFVDEVILGYRIHDSNMTKNDARMREITARAWRKAWQSAENAPRHSRAIAQGYRALHLFMARGKAPNIRRSLSRGQIGASAREIGYAMRHALRAVRGHP